MMKTITLALIVLFCCPLQLTAQSKSYKTHARKVSERESLVYYNKVFLSEDKDFKLMTSPEEYKDEPLVVLCQKTHIGFFRKSGALTNQAKGIIRKRVLIQDQAVLSSFSEFYYQESEVVGITVVKASGEEKRINLYDAIKVTSEVPRFYADYYHSADYYKIAIPDLVVGDIIDYYKVFTENYTTSKQDVQLITPISYSYPIVHQEVIFDIGKRWSFYHKSLNGAPDFVEDLGGGVNNLGKKRKAIKRFVLKDDFRKMMPDERWDLTYRTEPIIKVMASLSRGNRQKIRQQLDVNKTVQLDVNEAQLAARSTIHLLAKQIRRSEEYKKGDAVAISNLTYLKLRQYFLKEINTYTKGREGYYKMQDNVFTCVYIRILKKLKVEAELVFFSPRYYGEMGDVITKQEIKYAVYVPAVDKYFLTVDNYLAPGEFREYYHGVSCYKVDIDQAEMGLFLVKEGLMPMSKASNNVSETTLGITVKEDNSLQMEASLKYTGIYKNSYAALFINKDIYSSNTPYDVVKEKLTKEKLTKDREELLENWIKSNYEIESMDDFTLVSSGRTSMGEPLQADFVLSSKDYVKKAGRNLVFDVGKLISGQVELEEKEINERTKDIELGYARTIKNTFYITLPAGLTVKGIDNLAMSVDNATGTFVSEAHQEGNMLSVKTTKVYKHQTLPKAEWGNLVEMLEAAYKFSQLKVILQAKK